MDFQLAFMIIIVSFIVFFIEEISECSKRFWNNLFLRHSILMLFFGFYGLSYASLINIVFQHFIHNANWFSAAFSPYIPFFKDKITLMFIFIHLFASIFLAALFLLLYFILKRKCHDNAFGLLWGIWLVIGVIYIAS